MPLSVDQGFDTFQSWLAALPSEHARAARHQKSVFGHMNSNYGCYEFKETGSFGNGTSIRHRSDTDYFAVCTHDRISSNSGYMLGKIRDSLQYTFHATSSIVVNKPAVRLQFGQYASETLELTPAKFKGMATTPLGLKASYWIPNYENGWMESSPDAHNAYVRLHDNRLRGMLKPLIQFIKAWKYFLKVPISSFYLELRVTRYAESRSKIAFDIDLSRVFNLLENNNLASMRDPMGISGLVDACSTDTKKEVALSKLATAASRARKDVELKMRKPDKAFEYWDLLFNEQFPNRQS